MDSGPSELPRRCNLHQLALSPRGECILCRREPRVQTPQTPFEKPHASGALPWVKIGVVLLMLGFAIGTVLAVRELLGPPPVSEQRLVVVPDRVLIERRDDPSFREQARQLVVSQSPSAPREDRAGSASPAQLDEPSSVDEPRSESIDKPRKKSVKPDAEELRVLRRQVNVTVYTTKWCGVCRMAKGYLQNEGISYEEFDIDEDSSAQERMRRLNPENSVPTFDIEGTVLRGWSARGLQDAITRAAVKRWKRNEGVE
jgi:glutaredoxin